VRILFITSSRIGDAVLSTGLLNHLAETHPRARFTVACGTVPAPLFAQAPFVERVIPMVKRRRAGHWFDLWRATFPHWWHMVVDLRGSALAYAVPTLRRRVLKSAWEPEHRLVHLSSALGLATPFAPRLWDGPADEAAAARLIPAGPPVLAVGPTANWGGKRWPADRFAALAERLTAADGALAGARVAVFGAAFERELAQPVLDAIPPERRIDAIGGIELRTVHAALRRCACYVGNDSGLMHIAAAAGIPTLGLFGPSSEVFYAPWGKNCVTVRGPRSFIDICHAPEFDHRSHACLMEDLSIDKVVAAATDLFRRRS